MNRETRLNGLAVATIGRLWLVLRYFASLDKGNYIAEDRTLALLSDNKSPYYLGNKKYLRKLLRQGDGTFWNRNTGRIWLVSAPKAAATIGVEKFTDSPVEIPLSELLGKSVDAKAGLYAATISGRKRPMPISRGTIKQQHGVSKRRQRAYEKRTVVRVQRNFAEYGRYTPHELQRARLYLLKPAFAAGAMILWRMSNTYIAPATHDRIDSQSNKQLNRKLKSCKNLGGINQQRVKLYYDTEEGAMRVYDGSRDIYAEKRDGRWDVFLAEGWNQK